MNVFMQGMRRSGTTIIFDILSQDKGLDLYYEPFAYAKEGDLGGGSEMQQRDLFENVRAVRSELMEQDGTLEPSMFNYGAPSSPLLEFEEEMPPYCEEYLRAMIKRQSSTVMKFTRMYNKTGVLKRIDGDAKYVHIVRDPRAVTISYLFGKKQVNRRKYFFRWFFFWRSTRKNAWKMHDFSEYILRLPEYSHLKRLRDYQRVLLIWKYTFERTYKAAREAFGENYLLLRHEDLVEAPEQTVRKLYGHFDRELPGEVIRWAKGNLRQKSVLWGDDSRWKQSFDLLGMEEVLTQAGYHNLLE